MTHPEDEKAAKEWSEKHVFDIPTHGAMERAEFGVMAFLSGLQHAEARMREKMKKLWNDCRAGVACDLDEDNECHLVPGLRFKYDTFEDWEVKQGGK